MCEWKEPTDFTKNTVDWELRREKDRALRLKHYSEYQSQSYQKEAAARLNQQQKNKNKRVTLQTERMQRELKEKEMEEAKLRETLSKKSQLMEKFQGVVGKNEEKKKQVNRTYNAKLKEHNEEMMRKEREKQGFIMQDKKTKKLTGRKKRHFLE